MAGLKLSPSGEGREVMKLTEIDLTRVTQNDRSTGWHEHPDIVPSGDAQYLALIKGRYYAGTFTRQWYGLNFDGWHYGLQLDKPGTNASNWERLWRIET